MQLGVVSVYTYPSWLSSHLHDVFFSNILKFLGHTPLR